MITTLICVIGFLRKIKPGNGTNVNLSNSQLSVSTEERCGEVHVMVPGLDRQPNDLQKTTMHGDRPAFPRMWR